ncbi:flagellar motor protein MotB [Roseivivax sp. CAU 1761]
MSVGGNVAPVIIKRKKVVGGGGHHGGAWKVAYADFVTAMMAFFMLMWLLNATTEKQRKGLADYFSPTISISRTSGGGSEMLAGPTVIGDDRLPRVGAGDRPAEMAAQGDTAKSAAALEEARRVLLEKVIEAAEGNSLLQHVRARISDQGLVIGLHDLPGAPLFAPDNRPGPLLERLLGMVASLGDLVVNRVALGTHSASYPRALAVDPAWEVSAARGAALRGALVAAGLRDARIARIVAHGDRSPAHDNPMSLFNNRVEIVFLR